MRYLIVPLDIFLGFDPNQDIRPLIDLINREIAPEHQVQLILENSPEHLAYLEQEAMKRNNLTTSVVAGLAAIAGIASTANAVELNPDGFGTLFSYPGQKAASNPHHQRTQAAMQQRFKQPQRFKPRRFR